MGYQDKEIWKKALAKKEQCPYCKNNFGCAGFKRHVNGCSKNPKNLKECPACKKLFYSKYNSKTCSYGCSNSHFRSGKDNPNYNKKSYRNICFENHEKECVVCGEDKIVEVHHYDENHDNNDPNNLVPLCPTHHKYCHSRHKHLIEDKIKKYIQGIG